MLSAMVVTARREEMEGADGHDPLGVNMLSRDKRLNDAALASPRHYAFCEQYGSLSSYL